jgi:hypothetical protein
MPSFWNPLNVHVLLQLSILNELQEGNQTKIVMGGRKYIYCPALPCTHFLFCIGACFCLNFPAYIWQCGGS